MKSSNITIDLEDKANDIWHGEIYDGNLKLCNIVGFFKVRDNVTFEGADPRSIVVKVSAPKGEKGETLGYLNFRETKSGSYVVYAREFKIPNSNLCFPVTGWLNISDKTNKQHVQLQRDNYYLENQTKHWQGKRNYCLDDHQSDTTTSEENPF